MTDIEVFRKQASAAHYALRTNTAGITHEESLLAPEPGGNCMNWVVGHVLHVYEQLLPLLGQPPVLGTAAVKRYDRGSTPIDAAEAVHFEQLLTAWDEASARIDAGLASLTREQLSAPPPIQGFGDTVSELIAFLMVHQAYHSGQAGVLRRIAGKAGAIA
jgi:uncharacterized damage-inducible protein DinB